MTVALQYEDLNEYDAGGGYAAPNEEPEIWTGLIKELDLDRAAGICSGGEVAFFSLLPHVKTELVLVDHSYYSLYFALCKFLLLSELGVDETIRLLSAENTASELEPIVKSLIDRLPPRVQDVAQQWSSRGGYGLTLSGYSSRGSTTNPELTRYWEKAPVELVKQSTEKLGQLRFLHGDLTDLVERGPFDLVYLSNALEHSDRWGRNPLLYKTEAVVKPGGYILDCSYREHLRNRWECLETIQGSSTSWVYHLYRVPE